MILISANLIITIILYLIIAKTLRDAGIDVSDKRFWIIMIGAFLLKIMGLIQGI